MPISIDQANSDIVAGGDGTDGDLVLLAADGARRIRLDASRGDLLVGGNGFGGDLRLFAHTGDNDTLGDATIHLNGNNGDIGAGGQGQDGDLVIFAADGTERIRLDGGKGDLSVGGNGFGGDLRLFAHTGDNQTLADATIHLNGNTGDIILSNADCAEDFEVEDPTGTEPGTVMVIGDESSLRVSEQEYDRRVAGVIAGGGEHGPGIVLGRGRGAVGRLPIALIGRVLCKVDAGRSGIDVGDLLTTSQMRGHAMKAADPARAVGAIIGKALGRLESGQGFIPVLVSLQ
jgi:hypothetical protein